MMGYDGRRPIRRALLSVYEKTGLLELARGLHEFGVDIVSTGSTAKTVADQGIPVTPIEYVTGFPEVLDGRVKTLHPHVHAGLLADTRFDVLEATDGAEGLRLATRERPWAVFLDLDLPGLGGVEVLDALEADPALRHVPVVLHTARVLEEPERQRLARRVAAILPKDAPSRDVAVARLREALTRAGAAAARGGRHD